MERIKENAFDDFITMIQKSWTYEKLTNTEKEFLNKTFNCKLIQKNIKGTYQQRWETLQGIYEAFLYGAGCTGFKWRETEETPLF